MDLITLPYNQEQKNPETWRMKNISLSCAICLTEDDYEAVFHMITHTIISSYDSSQLRQPLMHYR